jgi:hypothetical protein
VIPLPMCQWNQNYELPELEAILNVIFQNFSKEEEQKLYGELNEMLINN